MAYKFETSKIKKSREFDLRIKLNKEDREEIVKLYKTKDFSLSELWRAFNVSRTLIKCIVDPERCEKRKLYYKETRKDWRYYDREKHKIAMRKYRRIKQMLLNPEKKIKWKL